LENMYFQGQGVKLSYPKAYLWWRLAEDLNIDGARQNINMIKGKMSKEEYNKRLRFIFKLYEKYFV